MDSSIRLLLQLCLEGNDPNIINEPYKKLKAESERNGKTSVGTDLYVICAEAACQYQNFEIAEDCVNMYFKKSPPANQYLCRAYMCQAQLHAPTSTKNPAQIEKAVHYLVKAINFAKQNSRYHFLVYNASVLYWQFCRPFLKPNSKRFLAKTLNQVVKALDDINDEDYEWRAQLMIILIECHIDAGRKDDAREMANSAAQFTKNNMPNLYKNVLGLQIQHRLVEYNKLGKELKSSPDLHLYFKIYRLKMQLESEEKTDAGQDLAKFFKGLTGMSEKSGTSTEISDKSSNRMLVRTASPVTMETNDRMELILELGKICMSQGLYKLTYDCLDYVDGYAKDHRTNLQAKFIQCELKVKSLGSKQEMYSQSIVQVRLQAIEQLEKYLMTALRHGYPQVIQVGCMTMWNLCLPLLQPNLRQHVRKPLNIIADALESIDSLSTLLRCQIHTELAKCEEDEEQLELAVTHLRKALMLDDDGMYSARLETSLTRIQLRSTLYRTPERSEDVAAMIIEQARTCNDSGTSKMKRASLVKAGNALAPDAFAIVLESESEPRDPSKGKEPPSLLAKLASRADHFEKAVSKAAGHLKRLGTENDQERVRIWADLTKTARKQQIWDVARVAAKFCLLYDDGRWSATREKQTGDDEGSTNDDEKFIEGRSSSGTGQKKSDGITKRISVVNEEIKCNVEKDLLRILAEIHLINAEALVQFLKNQNVQLCDKPIPPLPDLGNVPSRKVIVSPEDCPEWSTYREWISSLSQSSIGGFQRAAQLGSELQEPWLVCNSAVYILNYTTHLLAQKRHRELVPILTPVLQNLKLVGHSGEAILVCQLTNVLATGLMQPWYPVPKSSKQSLVAAATPTKKDGKKDKTSGAKAASKITTSAFDPDALAELRQALEHLEFALQVTNGNEANNLVPISVRHSIIKTWVHCKQLLAQQIPKNLGHESDDPNSQGPMNRCLCAVEMLSVHLVGLAEFSTTPSIQEVVRMVGNCVWSDDFVALEMWSRLAVLAHNADNHQVVMTCGNKALSFVENDKKKKTKKINSAVEYKQNVKQHLLYYASVVMGQSLIKNMKGQTDIRRDALVHFVNACRFGQIAKNYDLVIASARHYWNSAFPLLGEPLERILLREPLEVVLQCIADVADKNIGKDDEDEDEEEQEEKKKTKSSGKTKQAKDKKKEKDSGTRKRKGVKSGETNGKSAAKIDEKKQGSSQVKTEGGTSAVVNVYDEDLKMRAAMYGVLFQAYADKGEWEQGLRAMDQAVKDMPRTSHRLLIFKHRVITKAKLGKDVQFDMGKFKNENELVVSSMWHHVAMNSANPREQLVAYQNSIDVLEGPQSDWQKVDYLLEFGEWLFVNEFPLNDATDQFMWATDILLGRSENEEQCSDNANSDQQVSTMSTSCNDLKEIFDVRTLEYLVRTHIMLAQLVGRKSSKFIDYCLFAVACIQRIWKVTLECAEKAPREAPKAGDVTPTKKVNKEKPKDQKDIKSDKSTGKTCYPSTLQAWAMFELPEKFAECLKCDYSRKMISASSFVRPALSVHYFNTLVDDMCCLGYNHLTLPITSLLGCLAKHVMENELLVKFVHLRTMEICQDLRLLEEAVYHETAAKENENDENEIAKSREEIELWKEKQRQVKTEEARLLTNNDIPTNPSSPKGQLSAPVTTTNETKNWMKYKTRITRIERRDIWVKIAGVFIKQGHYQFARKLLNEANTSALVFEDTRCRAEVLYHLALLAFYESNSEQAISLIQKVQAFNGDHSFWLKTILLLVDAICDRTDIEGIKVDSKAKDSAITVLRQSIDVVKRLSEHSLNKACMTDYVVATLEATLGIVIAKETLAQANSKENSFLSEACEYLVRSEDSLCRCGYVREAIKVKRDRAGLMRNLATHSSSVAQKRDCYLKALSILKDATKLSNVLLNEMHSMSSLEELPSVSLPTEREAVETRLYLCEVTVEIMSEHTKDERMRRNKEARKGSVEKLIDDFVQDEPDMSDEEKRWHLVTRTITEDTLANLSVTFNECLGLPRLKTKCCLVLGHRLRTLASYLNPDDEPQWNILGQFAVDQPSSTANQNQTEVDENACDEACVDEEHSDTSKDLKSVLELTEIANSLKREYKEYLQTLTQAVECLTQCVQLGMKHGFTELVADASYHLVEIFGRHDMRSASLYLALFQSCSMSRSLHSLLRRCLVDSSLSRLAALIKQRELLCKKFLHQDAVSSVLSANTQALPEFEAWKRLSISKNHLDLAKDLSSPNTLYLVLQHSKDRSCLYAATLEKPRSGVSSAKSTKQSGNAAASSVKPMISRSKVDCRQLDDLLTRFEQFKSAQASELIRQNYLRRQAEEKRKMLATVDSDGYRNTEDVLQNDPTVKENEQNLEQQFIALTKEMGDYLNPVLEQLKPVLQGNAIPETLVIFADEDLLRLPLESLSILSGPQLQCVARDFSLQMHHHRLHSAETSGTDIGQDNKKTGQAGKKGGKGEKPPGTAKSQEKKGDKKVSKDQGGIPKDGIPVDIAGLRYIIDPFNECAKGDDNPEKVFNDIVIKYKHLSGKWSGRVGKDRVASVGEWQNLMTESTCFMFYGTQKCLNYIPPSLLVPLSLPDCNIMLILDQVETNDSFSRQGAKDVTKTSSELALVSSFESAVFMSLTGANCIIGNQWNCTSKENKEKLIKIIEVSFDENKNIGCAFGKYARSWLETSPPVEPSAKAAEEQGNIEKDTSELHDDQEPKNKQVISKNAVLYGIPYFVLNPQKV